MDYVYVCRSGENQELKYSIRSIIKNLNAEKIWVVGDKPDWYSGRFIPVKDIGNKFQNIQNCLSVICDVHEISEDFVLMNDDFYVLDRVDYLPDFHGGSLSDKIQAYIDNNGYNQYSRILADAYKRMSNFGLKDLIDYDIHVPMKINRYNMKQVVNLSLAPRSFYGNYFKIGGEEIKDVKIKKNTTADYDIFVSTEDYSFNTIEERLQELFPEPSQYEKY